MQKRWLFIMMVLLGALAACNAQPTPVLPTLLPTSTTVPQAADTDTPQPEATRPTATGFSLPPTWTFTPVPSETPQAATPTVATAVPQSTALDVCGTFAVDTTIAVINFPANTEPVIAWTAVQGAQIYRVTLLGPDSLGTLTSLFDGYTDQTSYTFTSDLYTFEVGTQYGWEVYPIDNLNRQMCTSRGGELTPFTP